MPKIDLAATEQTNRTGYPDPFAAAVGGRWVRRLGPGSGLADIGISHVVLKPGAASSQRHWHEDEDEFVVMLSGQAVLIEEEGRFSMQIEHVIRKARGLNQPHNIARTQAWRLDEGRSRRLGGQQGGPHARQHHPPIEARIAAQKALPSLRR